MVFLQETLIARHGGGIGISISLKRHHDHPTLITENIELGLAYFLVIIVGSMVAYRHIWF